MSGETEKLINAWTTDTLKETLENEICAIRKQIGEGDRRYEQRFDGQEKATNVALQSAKEAVIKAETATEKRFDAVNEFRAALTDQSANMISRSEYSAAHKNLEDKIAALDKTLNDKIDASTRAHEARTTSIVTTLSTQINDLIKAREQGVGRSMGLNASWGYLVALAGIVISAVALIAAFR